VSRKTIHLLRASTLFLVITMAIIPAGNTVTWSDETRLTTHEGWDLNPSILQMNDGRILVVWQSDRNGNWDIFCKIHNLSWSDPMPLTTHPTRDLTPSIMQTNDGTIWLFWSSNRTGNFELFYKTSSNNVSSWSNAIQLTEDSEEDFAPSTIQTANGTIWVVWQTNRINGYDIFYKTSSNNGSSWSNATRLTTTEYNDGYPSITQMRDGTIWVVWEYIKKIQLIYCKTSSDGGASWSDDIQLSELETHTYMDTKPTIAQMRDGAIWLFWASDRIEKWDPDAGKLLPQNEIFCRNSTDNGATWSEDIPLTNSTCEEYNPSVAQISDKEIWITFVSDEDDNYDIYCMNSSEIVFHDVAITGITPNSTMVGEGKPVSISVTAENQGNYTETFTVDCYASVSEIVKVEVGFEAYTSTDEAIRITISWDGGTSWATEYFSGPLPTSDPDAVTWVDFTDATSWTGLKLSDANLRVRAKSFKIGGGGGPGMGTVFLDWIPVRVTYVWGAVTSTNSPGSTSEVIIIYPPSAGWNNPAYAYSSNDAYAFSSTINATQQYGDYGFNILETILIGSESVTLSSGNSTTAVFSWDTTGFVPAIYPITATASAVPGEYPVNLDDNIYVNGTVFVTFFGDFNFDGDVNPTDWNLFAGIYGTSVGHPSYKPEADFDNNGAIDPDDFNKFAGNYGKSL
jgi:hypothetical protein